MSKSHAKNLLLMALAVPAFACGAGEQVAPTVEGVMERETFIEVYVELRSAAVQARDLSLSDEEREAILARHGVDEEGLISFANAYGRDLDYMNELWAEVEQRIEELPPVPRR